MKFFIWGTLLLVLLSASPSWARKASNIPIGHMTAYCRCTHCCGRYAKGKTASGELASRGGCAADLRYWKFGQKVKIYTNKGVFVRRINDTGKAIKGKHVFDLYLDSHSSALKFGRAKVYKVELVH